MNIFRRIQAALRYVFARYDAAQTWNPNFSRIPTNPQDARFNVTQSSRTVIAEKAKHFEDNNAVAQRIGSVFCDYTVGPNGLVLIPNSSDANWNAAAKKYWNDTATFIDLRSRQNFGTLQGLIAWRWLFDGEIFILKTRGQAENGKTYPRIQLLEYYCVNTPPEFQKEEGKTIIDGVRINSSGRPIGYYVRESSQSNEYRLVDAKDIIHVFEPSRPGQYRGISAFHAAINYLHRLDDLQDLEFRAITDAAEKSTFIETVNGEMPPGLLGSIPGDSYGLTSARTQITQTTIDDLKAAIGGRMIALKQGEKPTQFIPQRPTDSTRALWSYLTSCVCAAVGIPKMVCFSEWLDGAQGTVVRGDYDIAASFFRSRSAVIAAACREVYIYCLGYGIGTEKDLATKPADWTNVTIRAPRAVNVDVGRNDAAEAQQLADGRTNYDLIYAPRGLDWQEELTKLADQIAFINQLAASRGIQPSDLRVAAAQPQPAPIAV